MRKPLLVVVVVFALSLAVAAEAAQAPARIDLPDGFQPEGIAAGRGHELFVGSIPTGDVVRLNAKTGRRATVVHAPTGRAAIGLKADGRRRLFVAGGPTGKAFVYSLRTGAGLKEFQLAPTGAPTFVNDVALTRKAAYFTDSRRASLYVVRTSLSGARELPLKGLVLAEGNNLNGIVAAGGGRLLAVQSNTGTLWRIGARSGNAKVVALGGATLGERRRAAPPRTHALRRPEPPEQDRGRAAQPPPDGGQGAFHDHEPRVRRPDHDRPQRRVAVRGQRPLRHCGDPGDGLLGHARDQAGGEEALSAPVTGCGAAVKNTSSTWPLGLRR